MHVVLATAILLSLCSATKVYDKDFARFENSNNYFFVPSTFGMDFPTNADGTGGPCTRIARNEVFRNLANRQQCRGQWCNGGRFACSRHGNTDCYHVEHIIDSKGYDSDIDCGDCKEIAGNMVMAWGRWNKALGGLAANNYGAAQREKRSVYSDNRVNRAKAIILECYFRSLNRLQTSEPLLNSTECDDPDCNCDSDSSCGCDCDYEIETVCGAISVSIFALFAISLFVVLLIALHQARTIRNLRDQKHAPIELQELPTVALRSERSEDKTNPFAWNR